MLRTDKPASAFSGRVAIVTGGGSGIGRAVAHRLALDGATVVVCDVDGDRAAAVAAEIAAGGGIADAVACDVSDEAAVEAIVGRAVAAHGSLDVVHNNAALTDPATQRLDLGPVEISLETWSRILSVNLTGQMLLCKFAIPHMLAVGRGSIVNMSSTSASFGDVNGVAYSVSKAGVEALTRAVATKYGPHGIRCNALAPGIVNTGAVYANLTEAIRDEYRANLLVPEPATPESLAAVVTFLASDAAGYINGQVITADGGLTAHVPVYAGIKRRISESNYRRRGEPS